MKSPWLQGWMLGQLCIYFHQLAKLSSYTLYIYIYIYNPISHILSQLAVMEPHQKLNPRTNIYRCIISLPSLPWVPHVDSAHSSFIVYIICIYYRSFRLNRDVNDVLHKELKPNRMGWLFFFFFLAKAHLISMYTVDKDMWKQNSLWIKSGRGRTFCGKH